MGRDDDLEFLSNLCPHLKPLVEAMLVGGASVIGVQKWLDAEYALSLTAGLNVNLAIAEAKRHGLAFSGADDRHYAIEYFLTCRNCKNGVSWPQGKSIIELRLAPLPDLSIN